MTDLLIMPWTLNYGGVPAVRLESQPMWTVCDALPFVRPFGPLPGCAHGLMVRASKQSMIVLPVTTSCQSPLAGYGNQGSSKTNDLIGDQRCNEQGGDSRLHWRLVPVSAIAFLSPSTVSRAYRLQKHTASALAIHQVDHELRGFPRVRASHVVQTMHSKSADECVLDVHTATSPHMR